MLLFYRNFVGDFNPCTEHSILHILLLYNTTIRDKRIRRNAEATILVINIDEYFRDLVGNYEALSKQSTNSTSRKRKAAGKPNAETVIHPPPVKRNGVNAAYRFKIGLKTLIH